jgi:hypothetical protein
MRQRHQEKQNRGSMSSTIETLLSAMSGEDDDRQRPETVRTTLPLAHVIGALQDKAVRMSEACPFRVGDLLTVRPGSDVRGAGLPHIVVEVFADPVTDMRAEAGSNRYLSKYTMRVAHFHGDDMTVHAVDHSSFERWTDAHANAWMASQAKSGNKQGRKVTAETSLNDVVRLLRGEGRKFAEAKITWKKGDLVEIQGYETSNAAKPMMFEGKAVGVVETVDHSDDTTRVVYFDVDGDRRSQWFKPLDLKPFAAVEPVGA